MVAPSKEALNTPLSPPPLDDEPGPATRRSGTYRDRTHTRWPDTACRTQHGSRLSAAPGQDLDALVDAASDFLVEVLATHEIARRGFLAESTHAPGAAQEA